MSKTTVRCLVASVVLDLVRRTRLIVMKARAVNVAILLLLTLELASGLGSFLVGDPDGRWVFWLHRAGASPWLCSWCGRRAYRGGLYVAVA